MSFQYYFNFNFYTTFNIIIHLTPPPVSGSYQHLIIFISQKKVLITLTLVTLSNHKFSRLSHTFSEKRNKIFQHIKTKLKQRLKT